MGSRRRWKKIFRRTRLYLPLALLLLTAMALFLPITSPWLANRLEREAVKALNSEFRIESAAVTLSRGDASLTAIELGDPANPFRVESASLQGTLAGLLGGAAEWPDRVRLSGLSEVELRQEGSAWKLAGGGEAIASVIENAKTGRGQSPGAGGALPRTPEISVAGARFRLVPETMDPITLNIQEVQIAERLSAASPVEFLVRGTAAAKTIEEFSFQGAYDPSDGRIWLDGLLGGALSEFAIPPLGIFEVSAGNLRVRIDAELTGDSPAASARVSAERFEIGQQRPGGQRWKDEGLEIRAQVSFNREERKLTVAEFDISGANADIQSSAEISLSGSLPGEGRVIVDRLPSAAVGLFQTELLDSLGVRLSQSATSSTLRLETAASGDFLDPRSLKGSISLQAGGWEIFASGYPRPARLQSLDVIASNERLEIRQATVAYRDLTGYLSASIPVSSPQAPVYAPVSLRLEGLAGTLQPLLRKENLIPAVVKDFQLDFDLEAFAEAALFLTPKGLSAPLFRDPEGSFAWDDGMAEIRGIPGSVRFDSGSARFTSNTLTLDRLQASYEQLQLDVGIEALGIREAITGAEPLTFEGRVTGGGPLAEAVQLAGRFLRIPRTVRELEGDFALDLSANGSSDQWEEPDYSATVTVSNCEAEIALEHMDIPLRDGRFTIVLEPDSLNLRNGFVSSDTASGRSEVKFFANLDEERLRVDAMVDSRLEFLSRVLVKDLQDVVMRGDLLADAWAEIQATGTLPEAPDLLRRWVTYLSKENLRIDREQPADLLLDVFANYRGGTVDEITPRVFPVQVVNIVGNFTFDEWGLHADSIIADVGTMEKAMIDKLDIIITPPSEPTLINFKLRGNHLNVDEWLTGWESQPWAYPDFPIRRSEFEENVKFLDLNGEIELQSANLWQYDSGLLNAKMALQSFSETPLQMRFDIEDAQLYGGAGNAALDFEIPLGEAPWLNAEIAVENADAKPFMDDLYEEEQSLDGRVDGDLEFYGQLLNYPTYTGNARYVFSESSFARSVVPLYVQEMLEYTPVGSGAAAYDSTFQGSITMKDETVTFPDFELFSPVVFATADGSVDFRGRLDFQITASFISRQLRNIPLLGEGISRIVDLIGRNVISYRLRGTVSEPEVITVPAVTEQISRLAELLQERPTVLQNDDEE